MSQGEECRPNVHSDGADESSRVVGSHRFEEERVEGRCETLLYLTHTCPVKSGASCQSLVKG